MAQIIQNAFSLCNFCSKLDITIPESDLWFLKVISYQVKNDNDNSTWQVLVSITWNFQNPTWIVKSLVLGIEFYEDWTKKFCRSVASHYFFGRFGLSWFFIIMKWSRRNKFCSGFCFLVPISYYLLLNIIFFMYVSNLIGH